jgi:hypothetical protein
MPDTFYLSVCFISVYQWSNYLVLNRYVRLHFAKSPAVLRTAGERLLRLRRGK